MTEASDHYRVVADGFTARVEKVGPEQWESPTPCTDWTVEDLVEHVIKTHTRVLANVEPMKVAEIDLGGDFAHQWHGATDAVMEALLDPTLAASTIGGMFGEQPFESLVARLLCSDTLMHTWDLARATGQNERLDPDAVAKAMEFLAPIDESIRRPGGFAAKIEPPAGADAQVRLLNFCGRAV